MQGLVLLLSLRLVSVFGGRHRYCRLFVGSLFVHELRVSASFRQD
jgi:hypothetical protein